MPEKKTFKILNRKIKLERMGLISGSISEVFKRLPNLLPSINLQFKDIPILIENINDFISYSFIAKEAQSEKILYKFIKELSCIIIKFEELGNEQVTIWGFFNDSKNLTRKSFEPSIRIFLEGLKDPRFFKIEEMTVACSQITTIRSPASDITRSFPTEMKIDPLPTKIYLPFRLIKKIEGDYLMYSSAPPAPHILIKLDSIEAGVFGIYYFMLGFNDRYASTNLETLILKTIFDVKNTLERSEGPPKEDPLTLLKYRLAKGDISEEEFLRKKKLLE